MLVLLLVAVETISYSQNIDKIINAKEVNRIESLLASDNMRGRKTGTPDIDRAADFISNEFKIAGLQPWNGNSFLQSFSLNRPKLIDQNGTIDIPNITEILKAIALSSRSIVSGKDTPERVKTEDLK